MLFFLLAELAIQVLAWTAIFTTLYLSDPKKKELINKKASYSRNFILYYYKYISLVIRKYFYLMGYYVMLLPFSVLMTILQQTKTAPYIFPAYFSLKYKVILTDDLLANLLIQNKKEQLQEKLFKEEKLVRANALESPERQADMPENKEKNDSTQDMVSISNEIALDANIKPSLQTFIFNGMASPLFARHITRYSAPHALQSTAEISPQLQCASSRSTLSIVPPL